MIRWMFEGCEGRWLQVNEYLLQQQDAEDLVEDGQACGENGVPDDHAAHRRSEASNAQQGEEEDAHVK